MNVLIVYCHPEPTSFNGAMRLVALETLERLGHSVVVSDLYAMGWSLVAGPDDFIGTRSDPSRLSIAREQTHAMEQGTIARDISAEQSKLNDAGLVVFQFPIWWFSMPAVMKGWAGRVFERGYAYLPGRKYDTDMFKGKLALVACTVQEDYVAGRVG